MWIQTGITIRKQLSWVLISRTLTFDLWPWPFAWTSLLSMAMTPDNFVLIGWAEHCEKVSPTDGQTDRRTDGRTDWSLLRAAWSQLKSGSYFYIFTFCRAEIFYRNKTLELMYGFTHLWIYPHVTRFTVGKEQAAWPVPGNVPNRRTNSPFHLPTKWNWCIDTGWKT